MVIVRESPNAKEPSKQPQWPPRSPHEALLSSPSGRKKIERLNRELSPSPTPRKRLAFEPLKPLNLPSDEEDEDEDEETLQLKLQAIEARLKLKKLQQAKSKRSGGVSSQNVTQLDSRPSTAASGRFSRALEPSAVLQPEVKVPVSPIKDRRPQPEPKSPARVILGIDKGLRAQDVSLKRPASSRAGGLSRSNSATDAAETTTRPKSFSERIAASRLNAQEQQSKQERIQRSRSQGFGLAKTEDDVFGSSRVSSRTKDSSRSSNVEALPPPATKRTASGTHKQPTNSNFAALNSSSRSSSVAPSQSRPSSSQRSLGPLGLGDVPEQSDQKEPDPSAFIKQPEASQQESNSLLFEPYSSLHLKRRLLDHSKVTRALQGREIYPLPRLLHEVKGPDYDPPDCESDFVVLGVLCSKSAPREHKNNPKSINTSGEDEHSRPKFMVMRLTDFKWEIDLFLFDTGFSQFWKLTEGTVIAVLNPGIMPPRNRDNGAFSLKVSSSEDTVLEIGTARDLGFCKSIKSDGHQCTQWIDKRKTEVCEFHISLQVDKARRGRMEFNTMPGMSGGKGQGNGSGGGKKGMFGAYGGKYDPNGLKKEGKYHDKYLHETMYIAPKELGLNAASLLDNESTAAMQGLTAKEARRKRRREQEKEDELAKKLGMKGNGAGSEYLNHHRKIATSTSSILSSSAMVSNAAEGTEPPDAAVLGLLSKTAQGVSLSPVKGRKRGFKLSSSSASEPMGWSGAFKRGILEPKDSSSQASSSGERVRAMSPRKSSLKQVHHEEGAMSPRKKARLLLPEKGIREPGRESFGGTMPGDIFLDDVDDDDLEIV